MKSSDKIWYGVPMYASRMGRYTTTVEQAFIGKALRKQGEGLRILDVGGGNGRHSSFARELGHHPIVLERDSAPIDLLLESQLNVPVVQADATALPAKSGAFDVVLTIEVSVCTTSENNANAAYFSEVARVLKDDGLFIFTTSNKNSYFEGLKKVRRGRPSYEQVYYSESVEDFRRKLSDAGFEVVACKGFRWPPFNRVSNNPLVPIAVFIETILMLRSVTKYSPWLCFAARKRR